jgi:single-strand DNA-binding protein
MYQRIIVVGNLGGDPEMRYLPDGTAVTNFSVATSRRWNDQRTGQPVEETTWFRVSVFGRQAESANQYLNKGRQVLVEGRMQPDAQTGGPRLWTGQDGTVRASYELRAFTVQFLGGRDQVSDMDAGGDSFSGGAPVQEEDDIPF